MTTAKNVLFLCTGNSARSIIAECVLNQRCAHEFKAFSAGSKPTGTPNPYALKTLARHQIDCSAARSKSWDEFARPDAPQMDVIVTVCDNAAGETCPVWPGSPATLHWGLSDPAAVTGSEEQILAAFEQTLSALEKLIDENFSGS